MLRKFLKKMPSWTSGQAFITKFSLLLLLSLLSGCASPPRHEKSLVPNTSECTIAAGWPTFQGDAFRLGHRPGDLTEPKVDWSTYIGIQSWLNNPIIVGDLAVVGSSGKTWNEPDELDGIYAVELTTGITRWFLPTKDDANGVALARCTVIATSDDGHVRGVNVNTGELIWDHVVGTKVYTNPLVIGQTAWIGDSNGLVTAIDISTGSPRWTHLLPGGIRGGLTGNGDIIIAASQTGNVHALSLSGDLNWKRQVQGVYAAPTILGDRVLLSFIRDTTYETPAVIALDLATGDTVWEASNGKGLKGGWANIRASVAISEARAFWAEAYTDRVVALSTVTGAVEWSAPTGRCFFKQWGSPVVLGDLVIVGRMDGGLHAHDVMTGSLEWTLSLADHEHVGLVETRSTGSCEHKLLKGFAVLSTPAIAGDGMLVVGTEEGYLYGIRNAANQETK